MSAWFDSINQSMPWLSPALVMIAVGAVAAAVLAAASKVFYVEVDPRVTAVDEALPGANCGGCGFAGCTACAEAIVAGQIPANACIAGGEEVTAKVAAALGVEVAFVEPKVAEHLCQGADRASRKYYYDGALDCRALAEFYGGDLMCHHGCLGLETCVAACTFDALHMGDDDLPELDLEKCVGCGNCERVCPTGVIRLYGLSDRLLHFNRFDECLAPCQQFCPLQINIPAYVELADQGRYQEVVNVIKERNPLPLICGRVCPAPCESGCRRAAIKDEPVHHNYIKRFVADWEMALPERQKPLCLPDSGKKAAIVGGGPAGLSAAYYLRRLGHAVTIFDENPELGGTLRYKTPEDRVPRKILDFEIREILDLGIETRCNASLEKDIRLSKLDPDYDAVFLVMDDWDMTVEQRSLSDWVDADPLAKQLKLTKGTIDADEETLQTAIPKIFSAGKKARAAAPAIRTGRQAARSIHRFFNGQDLRFPPGTFYKPTKIPESFEVEVVGVSKKRTGLQPDLPAKEGKKGSAEMDLPLTPELMKAEADRCLRCGTLCYLNDDQQKKREHKQTALEKLESWLRESP